MADERENELFPFKVAGQCGFRRSNGTVVVTPQFRHGNRTRCGVAIAVDASEAGFIVDGRTLQKTGLPPGWVAEGFEYTHDLLTVSRDGLAGYVTKDAMFAIAPQYARARPFDRTGATVSIKYGGPQFRIDRSGRPTGERFEAIRGFHEDGLFCGARLNFREMVLINGQGERVSNQTYKTVWQEHEGLIPVEFEPNLIGWLDTEGKIVMRFRMRAVGNHFESGLVPVQNVDAKWGLMNRDAEWVLAAQFDVVESVGPNRFEVGYMDAMDNPSVWLSDGQGKRLSEQLFKLIFRFRDGLAEVSRISHVDPDGESKSEFNFIDLDGRLLFQDWY